MVSGKRIYSDFKVFSRGYLRNKIRIILWLNFPSDFNLDFRSNFFRRRFRNSKCLCSKSRYWSVRTKYWQQFFLHALNDSTTMRVITVNATENFPDYLADHSASDGIIIPQTSLQITLRGNPVNVTVYGNPASSTSGIVGGTVNGYANYFNLNYFQRKYNDTTPAIIGITSATVNTQQTKYIDFLIPGLIGFSILTSPMFSLVNISSEYKKDKALQATITYTAHKDGVANL